MCGDNNARGGFLPGGFAGAFFLLASMGEGQKLMLNRWKLVGEGGLCRLRKTMGPEGWAPTKIRALGGWAGDQARFGAGSTTRHRMRAKSSFPLLLRKTVGLHGGGGKYRFLARSRGESRGRRTM